MMRIAVFDYKVIPTNPIGSCHRRIIQSLCDEYEFTVFSAEFDNSLSNSKRVRWVRVPVPTRPLALLFVAYHLVAPLVYLWHCLHARVRFDLVQFVESNLSFGDISYVQFCHRAYLKQRWKEAGARGLRGFLRYVDHLLHAWMEPWSFRRARWLVVPSQGLKRELEETYPFTRGKITVIHNPVDVERMRRPSDFDRESFRQAYGVGPEDLVMVFVALGHFERKGLPLILEAMKELSSPYLKLWVVGGEPDLVNVWRQRVKSMGLEGKVMFVGMQRDIRPFLWGADVFVFPSSYEAFPLVSLEAAAAGLPLIVTPIYGVEEFVRDGETGFVVERTVEGIKEGIQRLLIIPSWERVQMGTRAQQAVAKYDMKSFVKNWDEFYGRQFLG
ncbi:MAG: glycosyltransferase family 4 protein [Candidatus Bathyarchaeia archaeon]